MNGARTTFMRRGYLLTALAAAVLLAASPGIASAQSVGFVATIWRATGIRCTPKRHRSSIRRTAAQDHREGFRTITIPRQRRPITGR